VVVDVDLSAALGETVGVGAKKGGAVKEVHGGLGRQRGHVPSQDAFHARQEQVFRRERALPGNERPALDPKALAHQDERGQAAKSVAIGSLVRNGQHLLLLA
jgi:hypothetical protein